MKITGVSANVYDEYPTDWTPIDTCDVGFALNGDFADDVQDLLENLPDDASGRQLISVTDSSSEGFTERGAVEFSLRPESTHRNDRSPSEVAQRVMQTARDAGLID